MNMTVAEIMEEIDQATEPGKMSKQEAHDFLQQIIDEARDRMEALRDEMRGE